MNPSASALPAASGAVRLDDWGLIRVQGADATVFLQGQLTNDLQHLPAGQACLAAHCSPKGRMLASFVAWRSGDDWLLACSADLLPAALRRLSMYVLRAKCKLSDASAELSLWGLAGDAGRTWLGEAADAPPMAVGLRDGSPAVRLADAAGLPRWLLALPAGKAPDLPALDADTWRWLEVCSGVVRIVAATAEAFVPQMVNYELVGGVNFKKGCYPGQEVVARSQYRGTLKRRGQLLAAGPQMAAGQEIFSADDPGQPAGLVALAARGPDGTGWALAELKLSAQAPLRIGTADGPAAGIAPLPYALPQDAV